ncbi:MAG: type II secretion system minor pseudopilin GspI, partial [bacterium]|nr:type II secretion system minor pseudopilin GspI [bacterium]
TLLEILAAMAIVTVGMAAVAKTLGATVSVLQVSEDRLISSWVASNRLAELRLERVWPAAKTQDSKVIMGGREWFYREQAVRTRDQDLLRIDISVFTDPDHEYLASTLFGYVARYTPPTPIKAPDNNNQENTGENNGNTGNDASGENTGGEPEQGADDPGDTGSG